MKRLLRAAINIGLVVGLFVVVLIVGKFNRMEGRNRADRGIETWSRSSFSQSKMYPVPEDAVKDEQTRHCLNHNYIQVEANVSFVDPLSDVVKLRLKFLPCGDFGAYPKTMGSSVPLVFPVNLTFGSTVLSFKEKTVMTPGKDDSLPLYFSSGNINAYPYDVYSTNVEYITALYLDKQNVTQTVPLALSLIGALQSWHFELPVVDDLSRDVLGTKELDGTLLGCRLIVSRSWTVKLFSTLLTIIILVLPCFAITLAVTLVQSGRTPEPPAMSMSIALLFALPALRNAQPNVPPFGTTLDIFSFYIAYMVEACAAIILLVRFIQKIEVISIILPPSPPKPQPSTTAAVAPTVSEPPARSSSLELSGTTSASK